jgi:hypothetical protein
MGRVKKLGAALFIIVLFAAAALAEGAYPQIDISGFKKWEHKKVEIDPARNYFSGLTQLGGFYPTFTGGPWQERLQLRILGQLSENLSVAYDLEQQPETPEKFDVKVKYYNNELTFGDFTANFSGNEFVSASKYLNGVMLTAKDTWYDIVAVPSAKLKSQTMALTSQKGNNTKGPYNLGHGSIVEGSEQIQLNGIYLTRNVDYTIDYFEGKVTFNRLLNETDEFKYSYEYTNVMDLFFPSLSKRDFFGLQSRFTIDPEKFGKAAPKEEPVISPAREVFPTFASAEPEVQEEEASGRYRVQNAPLVKFSETLSFMGTQLKKNEDYIIRYDTGEIKLLTRFLPTSAETLSIDYTYYQTSGEVEAIPGIGSRGPYRTLHQQLVPESERVEVDGKLFVRDLDYTIDWAKGEMMFGVVIGPTSQIKIASRYNVLALPPETASKFPKELKLGATYLKESAKKGTGSPTSTVIESYTGQTAITNNYVVYLKNRPVLPSGEASFVVRLKQGGTSRELTKEVEYTVPTTETDASGNTIVIPPIPLAYITDRSDPSDGYDTGTLWLNNAVLNLQPTDEITVTYGFTKSIVGKYSGVGDGTRGPYYLRSTRDIVPGTETVQVWDQGSSVITTYTRNTSFEANAGDTGYSLNYNNSNPTITFNKELATTKNFQLIFQYVPPAANEGGDISQSAFGFDGSFKIGDAFKIDTAYAKSETDQVYVSETTVETFSGNGTKTYVLHSAADLIEGTEQISVNNKLLNKDIDYFVSYTKPGQFNFYYITPATADAISVQYSFQSISGVISGTKVKTDTAFRLGAETRLWGDTLTINGATKRIGFDFAPLGSTAIGNGSEYEDYNLNFKPTWQQFFTNYAYKFNKSPIGTTRTTFLRTYDHSVSSGINPGGFAKLDFGYRQFNSLDDPLANDALHNSDSFQESYSAGLAPTDWSKGALSLNQKYELRKTTSKNDTVDRGTNLSTSTIDYYRAGGGLKFTDRFSAGVDFQYNESTALNSLEAKTNHTRSLDNAYNAQLDLTMLFLQKWIARASFQDHQDLKFEPTPESTAKTMNETYHMDITPFSMLTGSLDHNRQERSSYVSGGENPLSLRTAGSARLTPFSFLSLGVNGSKSENIPETGSVYKTTGSAKAGDLDFTPFSLAFAKLNTRFVGTNSRQTGPQGTVAVTTLTDTFSQNYTFNLNVIPILPLTFGFVSEDYKNRNNAPTNTVSTETQNQTTTANTTLTLPFLPQLALTADYNQKITKDLLANQARPKTVTNGKASYQLFSWGQLIYDLNQEINKGEVQAGSVVDLDLKKTTTTIGMNITIPVDNPVLSNFNVLASIKQVDYVNNLNHADDFSAKLLSFEGTMNF